MAKDAVNGVLTEFAGIPDDCSFYDKDIIIIAREFQDTAQTSELNNFVLRQLKGDIKTVYDKWLQWPARKSLGKSGNGFQDNVRECSSMWQDIEPAILDSQPQQFPDPY